MPPRNGEMNEKTKNLTTVTRDLREDGVELNLKAQGSEESIPVDSDSDINDVTSHANAIREESNLRRKRRRKYGLGIRERTSVWSTIAVKPTNYNGKVICVIRYRYLVNLHRIFLHTIVPSIRTRQMR